MRIGPCVGDREGSGPVLAGEVDRPPTTIRDVRAVDGDVAKAFGQLFRPPRRWPRPWRPSGSSIPLSNDTSRWLAANGWSIRLIEAL